MGIGINTPDDSDLTEFPDGLGEDPTLSYNEGLESLMATLGRSPNTKPISELDLGQSREEGPFPLRQLLGSGGFGEVWEAEQPGMARVVAVKRIRGDLYEAADPSTRTAMEGQFRAEALITARLEHPNIVPVHEIRGDSTGRPHLAMKLVRGQAWSDRLRREWEVLSPEEFLGKNLPILIQVCNAVAFAHGHGVVHRDLKPAQVMLGEHGEVLLMDWGLAFVVQGREVPGPATDPFSQDIPTQKLATNPSGTPAYMAPEQTTTCPKGLGTWTDIYLLGGILYEILTGVPPHRAASSRKSFESASRGMVIPPSQRVSDRPIPYDLEMLCLRALAPQPSDRVASVEAFRDALTDHLNGTTRRLESSEITTRMLGALRENQSDYNHLGMVCAELTRALVLWRGNHLAEETLQLAHERFSQAALSRGDLGLARVEAERVETPERRRALQEAIGARELQIRNRTRQRAAALVGCLVLACALGLTAYFYIQDQAAAQRQVRLANQALSMEALRAYRARADAEELLTFMLEDLRPRLESMGQLPLIADVGERARQYFDRQDGSRLPPESVQRQAASLAQVARVLQAQGKSAEALATAQQALAAVESLPNPQGDSSLKMTLGEAWFSLGSVHYLAGRLDQARQAFERAVQACQEALKHQPTQPNWRGFLAENYERLGNVVLSQGDLDEAAKLFRKSLTEYESLIKESPDSPRWLRAHAEVLGHLGYILRLQGRLSESKTVLADAVREMAQAVDMAPGNIVWRNSLAAMQDRLGGVLLAVGDQAESLAAYRANVESLRSLTAHDPSNVGWKLRLAIAWNRVGSVQDQMRQSEAAKSCFEESLSISRKLLEIDPDSTAASSHIGWTLSLVARLAITENRTTDAETALRESLERRVQLVARDPSNRWWRSDVAQTLALMGELQLRTGKPEAALPNFIQAARDWKTLLQDDPNNEYWRNSQARALWGQARAHRESGTTTGSVQSTTGSIPAPSEPSTALLQDALQLVQPLATKSQDSVHLATLALVLRELGQDTQATTLVQTLQSRGHRELWLEEPHTGR